MTLAGLERALGTLLLDAAFCDRFFRNPSSAVAWAAGLPLSPTEIEALSHLSPVAIARFRESLEPSLAVVARVTETPRATRPHHRRHDMMVSRGRSFPLGATLVEGGVNFCVFSRHASAIELLLFDGAIDLKDVDGSHGAHSPNRTLHLRPAGIL